MPCGVVCGVPVHSHRRHLIHGGGGETQRAKGFLGRQYLPHQLEGGPQVHLSISPLDCPRSKTNAVPLLVALAKWHYSYHPQVHYHRTS